MRCDMLSNKKQKTINGNISRNMVTASIKRCMWSEDQKQLSLQGTRKRKRIVEKDVEANAKALHKIKRTPPDRQHRSSLRI